MRRRRRQAGRQEEDEGECVKARGPKRKVGRAPRHACSALQQNIQPGSAHTPRSLLFITAVPIIKLLARGEGGEWKDRRRKFFVFNDTIERPTALSQVSDSAAVKGM